jgi:hypothetical protein
MGEHSSLHELQHQGAQTADVFEPMDGRDVRVTERGQHAGFGHEARHAIVLIGKDARQDLQRDVATELRIACAIDVAHPARADTLANHVGAGAASRQIDGRFLREHAQPGR